MKDYAVYIFFSNEDQGYMAEVPDLPGCSAFGNTEQEALAALQHAREAWLATANEQGIPIPRP